MLKRGIWRLENCDFFWSKAIMEFLCLVLFACMAIPTILIGCWWKIKYFWVTFLTNFYILAQKLKNVWVWNVLFWNYLGYKLFFYHLGMLNLIVDIEVWTKSKCWGGYTQSWCFTSFFKLIWRCFCLVQDSKLVFCLICLIMFVWLIKCYIVSVSVKVLLKFSSVLRSSKVQISVK